MEDEFLKDVKLFLNGVSMDNFSSKHKDMMNLIVDYNSRGLKREKIIQLLDEMITIIYRDNYSDCQEEVLTHAYDRITGFGSPHMAVNLDD